MAPVGSGVELLAVGLTVEVVNGGVELSGRAIGGRLRLDARQALLLSDLLLFAVSAHAEGESFPPAVVMGVADGMGR